MTVQAERAPRDVRGAPGHPAPHRRRWVAGAALAAALAAGASIAGLVLSRGPSDTAPRPPQPVLGQPLQPLAIYRVVQPQRKQPAPGQQLVPVTGRPGHSTLLEKTPTIDLHIRYARVRPVLGHWQLELIAPEGGTFNASSTEGTFYDAVVAGRALTLIFVVGDSRGVNFGIGAGANWLSQADAVSLARSLTTSVSIAECSRSAIAANECA